MKEMEYSKKRKIEVLDTGEYIGYTYYIMNLGTHPTAYVKVPNKLVQNFKEYEYSFEIPIEVHGGITYFENHLRISEESEIKGDFVGWDYAHAGDYAGYYVDDLFKFGLGDLFDKKWTTQEILEDVKDVCKQLKKMEEICQKKKYKKQ